MSISCHYQLLLSLINSFNWLKVPFNIKKFHITFLSALNEFQKKCLVSVFFWRCFRKKTLYLVLVKNPFSNVRVFRSSCLVSFYDFVH